MYFHTEVDFSLRFVTLLTDHFCYVFFCQSYVPLFAFLAILCESHIKQLPTAKENVKFPFISGARETLYGVNHEIGY